MEIGIEKGEWREGTWQRGKREAEAEGKGEGGRCTRVMVIYIWYEYQ